MCCCCGCLFVCCCCCCLVWFGVFFFQFYFFSFFLFFFFSSFFITSLSLAGNAGRLTRVRHSSRKSSATHSYQCVQYFRVSKRRPYGCQCSGFLTCAQMLLNAISHGGCTESALRADSGRKIPCHARDSNPRQYCAWWLFSRTLYPLSCFRLLRG